MLLLGVGLYFGVGIGWASFALVEVGLSRGWSLLWRVPFVVCLWPCHAGYAMALR